ncbi:HDOD domain-containing protein [Phorcysia thermohydrogeniphila]|uniref:HDOD domain-containing protein n=1 Tax=Phorcysia thermohydrogeniphila TaxID=936138 RepID=A0A4R1GH90_9BACT|nr:HDOD domain-containing protein [Phorcysia thermohydrogeniphila]TCK06391.1 HDOD domain-containing protein [Phorcysia thermohydrogeniphila]
MFKFLGFGGKKSEKKKVEKETKEKPLNRRAFDRYAVEGLGAVNNISKGGCELKKENYEEVKSELLEVEIGGEKVKSIVVEDRATCIHLKFMEEFKNKELLKKHVKRLKEYEKPEEKPKIDFQSFEEGNSELKVIINLLSEINNPNTTTEKLTNYIEKLPKVKEAVLRVANSVESAAKEKITSLTTAIARIGFERLKEVVRSTIVKELSFENKDLPNFEHLESFSVLKSTFLTEILPYTTFRDTGNEARLLFTSETTPLSFFTKLNEDFKKFYTSVNRLYSPYSRYLERLHFGTDFLKLGKEFIVEYSDLFKYLYDGYILAHLYLYPSLNLPEDLKISLSRRKLDFSYISYLTFLTVLAIVGRDKKSAYILLGRLKRLGMSADKAMEFLSTVVENANDALYHMGLRRSLRMFSYPSRSVRAQRIFPVRDNIYFKYLVERVSSAKRRLVLRHEDRTFTGYIPYIILNAEEFGFRNKAFCIIPCENLSDSEIDPEDFSSFDIIVFRNVDLLPEELLKDFEKIWKGFEGTVICTYSTYSFLDWEKPELHRILREYVVDIPSFLYETKNHEFMVERVKEELEEVLGRSSFDRSLIFVNETTERVIYSYLKTFKL